MKASLLAIFALSTFAGAAAAQSTAFTYQGRVKNGDALANGPHDFRFMLFDTAAGGVPLVPPLCIDDVDVVDGLFTVSLDFSQQFVTTQARFLQIEVRQDTGLSCGDVSGLTLLDPRQPLMTTPIAAHAKSAFSLAASDGSPLNAVQVDSDGRVGIGTAAPASTVHAFGPGAALRLQDDDSASSSALLEDTGPGQLRLNKLSSVPGTTLIDINPMPLDGTSAASIRFFRETNTTGAKGAVFHRGNNTNAVSAMIGVGGGSSAFQLDGGNVGIGTATPSVPLHVARDLDSVIVLQDTGPATTQSGYIGFWNNVPTETAWVGYGTPGSPHFSVVNARAGGDIFLNPSTGGAVKIGASGAHFVPAAVENLRMVRGTIQITGTVFAGTGWTISHPATGSYVVTFSTPFASLPTITQSPGTAGFSVVQSSISNSAVTFTTRNASGVNADTSITFVAVGPR
jgi:hypothetical protein